MLRSMYSGITGMKSNQTKLDVIGNNVSNVGTTSFKSSRTTFKDMMSQSVSDAMAPSINKGGRNAAQVGMGVQLSSIDNVMTQGMMQPTGRALDVGIDGEGFFMVSNGPEMFDGTLQVNHRQGSHSITEQSMANSGSQIMYSRDGGFKLDESGNLLTADGFRVMGYSLTNDDSSQEPTAIAPNSTSTTGLDFKFGPGSQLNGYNIVLGSVGPGTVTTADVNKTEKTIVLNGDFSTPGALTSQQVENAINKGLDSVNISQKVFVTGKATQIAGLGSDSIKGGSDAVSPESVSVMGATFTFTKGSALNDFTIKVGNISAKSTKATVDEEGKTITIDGDFLEKGVLTSDELAAVITKALKDSGIDQQVEGTGPIKQLPGLVAETDDKGKIAKAPKEVEKGSFKITFKLSNTDAEKGNQLNGYTFAFTEDITADNHNMAIDKDNKKITIKVATGAKATKFTENDINEKLSDWGIEDVQIDKLTIPAAGAINGPIKVGNDGQALVSPSNINIAEGLTVKLPKGDKFNNIEIKIASLDDPISPDKRVHIEMKNGKITGIILKGDYRDQNVDSSSLEDEINKEILASNIYPDKPLKDSQKATVTGFAKPIKGLYSSVIMGGQDFAAPTGQNVFGFDFDFANGESLNGYKINIGTITAGTRTSATVDEKNKTITINGDFVKEGAVTDASIRNVVNVALQEAGIEQTVKVDGTANGLPRVESEIILGGTPVDSMNSDGSINFVDGTGEVKAYDGELITLKIPDKVIEPGTGRELRVKTYTIDSQGIINGVLEDGSVAALGQIAMASFKNPEGLTKAGGNIYTSSVNSGEATIRSGVGTLGDDNSKGYGDNLQGMLEMSNVDLSEQFTEMIVTSRAFQAAGKMITTGDEILQDIINLKR